MASKLHFLLPLLLLLSPISTTVHSRSVPGSDLISDGVNHLRGPNYLVLNPFSAESTCDPTYGFMPCTTTALGNLFLIIVYGYLMFMAATYLSTGSEMLLEILGPGVVGGLFLPILGALPDALLILVSGLSGTKEAAQSQVSVGMGLLAGSTVMLITVIWGSCVIVGKCDLGDSGAIDGQNTKRFSLTGAGVSTDIWTCYAAWIMAISIIPFIVVQLPQMLNSTSGRHLAVLIALILSLSLLVSYCLYQIYQPWIQKRRIAYAKYKHLISGILNHLPQKWRRLLEDDGELNTAFLNKLFDELDVDDDGNLSAAELKALMIGVQFDQIDFDEDDAGKKLLKDFDTDDNGRLERHEFIKGFKKWINEAKQTETLSAENGANPFNFLNNYQQKIKRERKLLGEDDQSDVVEERVANPKWTSVKAALLLLLGTIIAAAFADPLVDVVDNFSDATSIPAFFISFIALPLATNSSEAVSAIIFASRKKQKTASLTFSELYGAVTMNNILCLSVFLALVYARGLTWDFSSEVLVILIVCIVMGALGSFRTTFPLWTCSVAFILYPFSLALVYVLDYVFGWS